MGYQPSSSAFVLVRNRADLENAFRQSAPYLFHEGDAARWNSAATTLQCTRRSDALRAWIALQLTGTDEIAARQERVLAVTRRAWELVGEHPRFEALHEPETNILCFRHVPDALRGDDDALDRHNAALHQSTNRSGRLFLTATVLDGRRALRITVMNPRTGERELVELLAELDDPARASDRLRA
jgi:L-2,4-diaminobutyrate decarboxylase